MTIAEMFVHINSTLVEITSEKRNVEDRLRLLASELGCELAYCHLPGCGKPFVKIREAHRFCGKEHKQVYANKYRRS